jgi:hypothetical protein
VSIETESVDVYKATMKIVVYTLGLGIKGKYITFRPEIYAWLRANAPDCIGNPADRTEEE